MVSTKFKNSRSNNRVNNRLSKFRHVCFLPYPEYTIVKIIKCVILILARVPIR